MKPWHISILGHCCRLVAPVRDARFGSRQFFKGIVRGILLWACIPSAFAALGEHLQAVQLIATPPAIPSTAPAANYRIIASTDSTGQIAIRQYVDNNGVVFGIAWEGPVMPDLSQLLGTYFGEFQTALSTQNNLRNTHQINTGNLIINQWGHMRHYIGTAWAPALLPAGVSGSDIQ